MDTQIGKLTVELSVKDCEEALVKAMEINKSKLIEWRETMASHGYQNRVEEIQEYIDMVNSH